MYVYIYKLLYQISFGNLRKKLKRKYLNLKFSTDKDSKIYKKNKKDWTENNNQVIVVNEDGTEENIYHLHDCKIYFQGKNSTIKLHKNKNGIFLYPELIVLQNNSLLEIFKDCRFHKNNRIYISDNSKVIIKKESIFSFDIKMLTSDFHAIYDNNGKLLNPDQDIIIGEHCWIGYGSIIIKGSIIPDNSIIGSHSVFNRSSYCPEKDSNKTDNKIFAGNPAKVIKQGKFNWDLEKPSQFSRTNIL